MKEACDVLDHIEWIFESAGRHPTLFVSCGKCLEDVLASLDNLRWFILDDENRCMTESYESYLTSNGFGPFSFMKRREVDSACASEADDLTRVNDFVQFWRRFLEWRRQFAP